jgi:hypothetical protein
MNPPNNLSILSRLILSKIISSGITKFIKPVELDELNKAFLSETPEKACFDLKTKTAPKSSAGNSDYYNGIVDLMIRWNAGQEQVDPDGNAWQPYDLVFKVSTGASYSIDVDRFRERAECVQYALDLVDDLRALVPSTIMVMTLNSEQKIARDLKTKYDADVAKLAKLIRYGRKDIRSGLRVNSKTRVFRGQAFESLDITPGTFEVKLEEGPMRCPSRKTRVYKITVPSDLSRHGSIHRLA